MDQMYVGPQSLLRPEAQHVVRVFEGLLISSRPQPNAFLYAAPRLSFWSLEILSCM